MSAKRNPQTAAKREREQALRKKQDLLNEQISQINQFQFDSPFAEDEFAAEAKR